MSKKIYRGSCTCGTVEFSVELDLAKGTTRCNCSFCRKARMWIAFAPIDALTIVRGADALVDYQRAPANKPEPFLHLYFCRTCGIHPFTKGGVLPAFGGELYAVNVGCLDAPDEELAAAPIHYADGRNDDWAHETPLQYL